MKKLFIKLSLLLPLALPFSALAIQDVALGTGTVISVGGLSLTVTTDNSADEIVVGSSSFTATLSKNSTLTIVSSDKRKMTFSQTAGATQLTTALTCNTSDSTYTVTNGTAGATDMTITVTPSSDTCSAGSGAAGGGGSAGGGASSGGGGGGTTSAAPVTTTTATPVSTATVVTTTAAPAVTTTSVSVGGGASVTISVPVAYGERSSNVKTLQEALARDSSVYPEGLATGWFGPATKRAIQRFQEKYEIAQSGDAGYGTFGPKTRAKFNEVYGSASTQVVSPTVMSEEAKTVLINSLMEQLAVLQAELKKLQAAQ